MTLPEVVFFPQSLLPLYIFEERYRAMLRDVLKGNRMFGVVGLDPEGSEAECCERPYSVGTVGVIRLCQKNPDGTANLVLQGLCRIRLQSILQEEPYRVVQAEALHCCCKQKPEILVSGREDLLRLLKLRSKFGRVLPPELAGMFSKVADMDALTDLVAHAACQDSALKQTLLETLDTGDRLQRLISSLKAEVEDLRLRRQLQGRLEDEDIANN